MTPDKIKRPSAEFTSDRAGGMDGYLADKGMIPLGDDERAKYAASVKMLATRQPMAVDLRKSVASLKIASDLELIADYCVNICKRISEINRDVTSEPLYLIRNMAQDAHQMLIKAAESFQNGNANLALEIEGMDDLIDSQYVEILNKLQKETAEDSSKVPSGSQLLHIARYLERLAGHFIRLVKRRNQTSGSRYRT